MKRKNTSLTALNDPELSASDLYLALQHLYRELNVLSEQVTQISATNKRLLESKLNALYRPKDIAEMVNVHHHTVLDWIKKGRLIPTEGTRVSGWELERFLKESSKYQHIEIN